MTKAASLPPTPIELENVDGTIVEHLSYHPVEGARTICGKPIWNHSNACGMNRKCKTCRRLEERRLEKLAWLEPPKENDE